MRIDGRLQCPRLVMRRRVTRRLSFESPTYYLLKIDGSDTMRDPDESMKNKMIIND